MANTKTYTVMKDGETIKELKSLSAAKKLADTEDAEVFCEGLCVYAPDPVISVPSDDDVAEEKVEPVKAQTYTLTRRMNVRKEPSLTAAKLKVLEAGATVEVAAIVDDWLCLTDGSFILYEKGKNAVKA